MPDVSRRESLPTAVYGRLFTHPGGELKEHPHPEVETLSRRIQSPTVITLQNHERRAVHLASSFEEAERIMTLPGTILRLGSAIDLPPEENRRRPTLTLGASYADFFGGLARMTPRNEDPELAVGLLKPLPAGAWVTFVPRTAKETHGLLGVVNEEGACRVYLFPSKAAARHIMDELTFLNAEDGKKLDEIEESTLPFSSNEEPLTLKGDIAVWIIAKSLLARPV